MNHSFRLAGSLDIRSVDALHGSFEALLAEDGIVTLEADGVERVDTSVFQLLFAFKQELNKRGFDLHWAGVSEAVIFTARTLGLLEALNLSGQH